MNELSRGHVATQELDYDGATARYREMAKQLRGQADALRHGRHYAEGGVAVRTNVGFRLGVSEVDQHIGPEQLEVAAAEFEHRANLLADVASAATGTVVRIPSQRVGE